MLWGRGGHLLQNFEVGTGKATRRSCQGQHGRARRLPRGGQCHMQRAPLQGHGHHVNRGHGAVLLTLVQIEALAHATPSHSGTLLAYRWFVKAGDRG
jgi:hypothetical protein